MKVIPYNRKYKREQFTCGKASLDNYILRNVTKDVKAGACACFIILNEEKRVIGYYTLSSESVPIEDAPDEYKKSIKYQSVPVILLGRLAVDTKYSGRGYGKFLLADSLKRSTSVAKEHVGAVAVIVDPIDEEGIAFYSKYGFMLLPDSGRMFMSIKKIEHALELNSGKN